MGFQTPMAAARGKVSCYPVAPAKHRPVVVVGWCWAHLSPPGPIDIFPGNLPRRFRHGYETLPWDACFRFSKILKDSQCGCWGFLAPLRNNNYKKDPVNSVKQLLVASVVLVGIFWLTVFWLCGFGDGTPNGTQTGAIPRGFWITDATGLAAQRFSLSSTSSILIQWQISWYVHPYSNLVISH